jgi:hypothetical protein
MFKVFATAQEFKGPFFLLLGVGISILAQYIGLDLVTFFQIPDPALTFLYSSFGLIVSIGLAIFFFFKSFTKKWWLVWGLVLGIPGWLILFIYLMMVTGTWL